MQQIPEISVQEVATKRANNDNFILVDVRESNELTVANLGDSVIHLPLSIVAQKQMEALPNSISNNKDAEIVVFCHHGGRSAQVVGWLKHHGWTNVHNMVGGINAYAIAIDPTIRRY